MPSFNGFIERVTCRHTPRAALQDQLIRFLRARLQKHRLPHIDTLELLDAYCAREHLAPQVAYQTRSLWDLFMSGQHHPRSER
jgi:hypothetical protein